MASSRYDELVAYLKDFQLCGSLSYIASLSHELRQHDMYDILKQRLSPIPTEWALAEFAKILIMHANDFAPRVLKQPDLARAFGIYNNLEDPLLTVANASTKDAHECLLRLAYEQFDFQEETSRAIPRTLLLFTKLDKENMKGSGFSAQEEFKKIVGIGIEDYIAIGFTAFSFPQGRFRPSMLYNSEIIKSKKYLTSANVDRFLTHTTISCQDFRERQGAMEQTKRGYEKYSFNLLKAYPIIKVSEACRRQLGSDYIIPINKYLFDKFTSGIYYDLQDASSTESGNKFLGRFGVVFERYVGLLLEWHLPKEKLMSAFTFDKGTKESIDWFVREGSSLVLIECKKSAATYQARREGDVDRIGEEIKDRIIRGVNQIRQNIERIVNKTPGFEEFYGCKDFHGMIVVYESLYWANSVIRDIVDDAFPDKLPFDYHIINIKDFELLVASLGKAGLSEFLQDKAARKDSLNADFKDYFISSGLEMKESETLKAIFDEFFAGKFGI